LMPNEPVKSAARTVPETLLDIVEPHVCVNDVIVSNMGGFGLIIINCLHPMQIVEYFVRFCWMQRRPATNPASA